MTEITAALYARVSTVDQHCEMQLRELREYVTRRGWVLADIPKPAAWRIHQFERRPKDDEDQLCRVCGRGTQHAIHTGRFSEYVDTGWSGAKASRPEFDRLKAAASSHLFDCVLVWKLDRFGRSVVNCVQGIQDLDRQGIRFLATSQNIDTDESSPTSRFMLAILAAVAELEREMTRERVMAGLKNARATGVRLGRPAVVIDRVRAREMKKRGMSVRQIAAKLNVSRSVAHRALQGA